MDKPKRARERDRDGEGGGRTRLLDAARDLFLARGYAAVSIGEIAAAAGVSRAAPYYHFKDKEDLFLKVFLREMGQMLAELAAIIQSDSPFRERLERIIVYALETKGSDTGRLFDDLHRHVAPERRDELINRRRGPIELFLPMFREAAAAGEIRHVAPEVAATVYLATVSGLMEMLFREKHRLPAEVKPAEIVDILLRGF